MSPFPVGHCERESRGRRREQEHPMTAHKSFKRLVRSRMEKTGESYTAARAKLLAGDEPQQRVSLSTSDATIRERTGRGWEEWFDLLDEAGGADMSHREMARWLAEREGEHALAWNVQAVVGSYERARKGREVGEHEDGFTVTASKTVAVPIETLYSAFVDAAERARWLPGDGLRERTVIAPRSARFDWGDDGSRVHVALSAKGDGKATAALTHERLSDGAEAARMKAFWRERVAALKEELES
jgi:uncharacterized protein YndB with AHSA1/START domain